MLSFSGRTTQNSIVSPSFVPALPCLAVLLLNKCNSLSFSPLCHIFPQHYLYETFHDVFHSFFFAVQCAFHGKPAGGVGVEFTFLHFVLHARSGSSLVLIGFAIQPSNRVYAYIPLIWLTLTSYALIPKCCRIVKPNNNAENQK